MGQIIKFQHEVYNGLSNGTTPDVDILYPKTSSDQVEGLSEFINQIVGTTNRAKDVKYITIIAGTATTAPKVRVIFQDNSYIESDFITTASTAVYGVTKLSSAINSSVENLAATSKAVKAAYDLANAANQLATQTAGAYNALYLSCNGFIIRVKEITEVNILSKKEFIIDLQELEIDTKSILDVICYFWQDALGAIVKEGVSIGWQDTKLSIFSAASSINKVKIVYLANLE